MIFVDGAIIAESPQRCNSTELKTGVRNVRVELPWEKCPIPGYQSVGQCWKQSVLVHMLRRLCRFLGQPEIAAIISN